MMDEICCIGLIITDLRSCMNIQLRLFGYNIPFEIKDPIED